MTIQLGILAMVRKWNRKWNNKVPQQLDLAMVMAVRKEWCSVMLLLFLLVWYFFPLPDGVLFLVTAGILILIAIYDWRYGLIYDRLVMSLLLFSSLPLICGHIELVDAVLGALLGSGMLLVLRYLSHGGLGLGDVKLAVPLGFWLGWQDIMLCFFLAACLALVYGGFLLHKRHIQRYTPIPFGPFLAIGALLAFAGGPFIRGYVEFLLW